MMYYIYTNHYHIDYHFDYSYNYNYLLDPYNINNFEFKETDLQNIADIVSSLSIRPFSLDVFLLREMTLRISFEFDNEDEDEEDAKRNDLTYLIQNKDYENIANIVHNIKSDEEIYSYFKTFYNWLYSVTV